MPLSGANQKELQNILVEKFTTQELVILVKHKLDQKLEAIVSPSLPGGHVAFELIQWAEREGKTKHLLQAVKEARSQEEIQQHITELLEQLAAAAEWHANPIRPLVVVSNGLLSIAVYCAALCWLYREIYVDSTIQAFAAHGSLLTGLAFVPLAVLFLISHAIVGTTPDEWGKVPRAVMESGMDWLSSVWALALMLLTLGLLILGLWYPWPHFENLPDRLAQAITEEHSAEAARELYAAGDTRFAAKKPIFRQLARLWLGEDTQFEDSEDKLPPADWEDQHLYAELTSELRQSPGRKYSSLLRWTLAVMDSERNPERAEEWFRSISEGDDLYLFSRRHFAICLEKQGKHEKAIEALNGMLQQLDPAQEKHRAKRYKALNQVACIHFNEGDFSGAEREFGRLVGELQAERTTPVKYAPDYRVNYGVAIMYAQPLTPERLALAGKQFEAEEASDNSLNAILWLAAVYHLERKFSLARSTLDQISAKHVEVATRKGMPHRDRLNAILREVFDLRGDQEMTAENADHVLHEIGRRLNRADVNRIHDEISWLVKNHKDLRCDLAVPLAMELDRLASRAEPAVDHSAEFRDPAICPFAENIFQP